MASEIDTSPLTLFIREAAEKFDSQDLWIWAKAVEGGFAGFFHEPPDLSAADLILICTAAAQCHNRVTGEPIGNPMTIEQLESARKIVLGMHQPLDTTWSN